MTEVVSRRPLTMEARLRFQLSPCEIYGKQSGTKTGFSPGTSVLSCQYRSIRVSHLSPANVNLTSRTNGRRLQISKKQRPVEIGKHWK